MPIISGSGGSGGGGLTRIFNSTLGVAAATIDTGAGGVTGGFTHLMLSMLLRGDTAAATAAPLMRFNNDSGANYDDNWTRNLNAAITGVSDQAATSINLGQVPAASATASYVGAVTAFIPNYAATTFFKQGNAQIGFEIVPATPTYSNMLVAFSWRSTAAITRIAVTATAGNWLAGSSMTVYGLT